MTILNNVSNNPVFNEIEKNLEKKSGYSVQKDGVKWTLGKSALLMSVGAFTLGTALLSLLFSAKKQPGTDLAVSLEGKMSYADHDLRVFIKKMQNDQPKENGDKISSTKLQRHLVDAIQELNKILDYTHSNARFLRKNPKIAAEVKQKMKRWGLCILYSDQAKSGIIQLKSLDKAELNKRYRERLQKFHPDQCIESQKKFCEDLSVGLNALKDLFDNADQAELDRTFKNQRINCKVTRMSRPVNYANDVA